MTVDKIGENIIKYFKASFIYNHRLIFYKKISTLLSKCCFKKIYFKYGRYIERPRF